MNGRIHQHQEVLGSWVVIDPTGRDMLECLEVGVVQSVRWDNDDDGDVRGYPRPILTVKLNGSGEFVSVTVVEQVLRRT